MDIDLDNFQENINNLFMDNIKKREFYLNIVFYISLILPIIPSYLYFINYRNLEKIIITTDFQLYFSFVIYLFLFFFNFILFNTILWILKLNAIRKIHPEYKPFISKFKKRFCHSQENIDNFIIFFDTQNKECIQQFIIKGKVKSRKCDINFDLRDL